MKITNNSDISSPKPVSKAIGSGTRNAASSEFSALVSSGVGRTRKRGGKRSTESVENVGNLAAIETLIAVQGIDENENNPSSDQQKNQSSEQETLVEHADFLLEQLKALQLQFLSGDIDEAGLIQLKQRLNKEIHQQADPNLLKLIKDIELRASVELAKFQRRNRLADE